MHIQTHVRRLKKQAIPLSLIALTLFAAGAPTLLPAAKDSLGISPAYAQSADDLEAQIKASNAKLKSIQAKLDAARAKLNSASSERKTVQSEVEFLENSITQLELSIEEDEATMEHLGYEISSLGNDIVSLREKMKDKQSAIAALLRDVQKREGTSPIVALFKSASLSDGLREAREITALQVRVGADLGQLRDIQSSVVGKIASTADKRAEIEARRVSLEDKIEIVADQKENKDRVLALRQSTENSYAAQYSAIERQQKAIAEEVESLEAKLRAQINKGKLPTGTPLIMPTEGRLTQGYGSTSFAKTGYAGRWHNGIDIGAPTGTPIYAAAAGKIQAAGNQDNYCPRGAYGRYIIISHNNGLVTMYAHLSKSVVGTGETVERGQLIGYVGNTGYATGPHLHFTVYAKETFAMGGSRVCGPMPRGGDLNPFNYL